MIAAPIQFSPTLPDVVSIAPGGGAPPDGAAFASLLAGLLLPLPIAATEPASLGAPSLGIGPAAKPPAGGGPATPPMAPLPPLFPSADGMTEGDGNAGPAAARAGRPAPALRAAALLPADPQEVFVPATSDEPVAASQVGAPRPAPPPAPFVAQLPVEALEGAELPAPSSIPTQSRPVPPPPDPAASASATPTTAAAPTLTTHVPDAAMPPASPATAGVRRPGEGGASSGSAVADRVAPATLLPPEAADALSDELPLPVKSVTAPGGEGTARRDAMDAPRTPTLGSAGLEPGMPAAGDDAGAAAEPSAGSEIPDTPDVAPARMERTAVDPLPAVQRSLPSPPAALQVGVQIAAAASRRVERLVVQLEPAALGRVEVRLDFSHDNRVSALIAVDRPETLDLLQRDGRALERSLQQAGLELDGGGLSFSLRQEQRHQQKGGVGSPRAMPPGGPSAGAERAGGEALRETRWLGIERVLDIRI